MENCCQKERMHIKRDDRKYNILLVKLQQTKIQSSEDSEETVRNGRVIDVSSVMTSYYMDVDHYRCVMMPMMVRSER